MLVENTGQIAELSTLGIDGLLAKPLNRQSDKQ